MAYGVTLWIVAGIIYLMALVRRFLGLWHMLAMLAGLIVLPPIGIVTWAQADLAAMSQIEQEQNDQSMLAVYFVSGLWWFLVSPVLVVASIIIGFAICGPRKASRS